MAETGDMVLEKFEDIFKLDRELQEIIIGQFSSPGLASLPLILT